MGTYRLRIKRDNAQLEVVAKSGALLAYEMDRYLENFLNRKIESAPYKTQKAVSETAIQIEYNMPQRQVHSDEPVYTQPIQYQAPVEQIQYTQVQEQNTPAVQKSIEHIQNFVEQNAPQQEVYVSLSDFLASNKSGDIFSEFIISAYYIKRILNIEYFTIKMLNSKFYPATESLVDLSIIDEARTRGFIEAKEEDGSLKYTLSPAGESYFINQLRG